MRSGLSVGISRVRGDQKGRFRWLPLFTNKKAVKVYAFTASFLVTAREPNGIVPFGPLRDELLNSKHYLLGIQFNLKIVLSCHIY